MSYLIITAGSVTAAVRIEKKLCSCGIFGGTVIHTPAAINSGGCSYSVRINYSSLELIRNLMAQKIIKPKKLFKEIIKNRERIYHDIS